MDDHDSNGQTAAKNCPLLRSLLRDRGLPYQAFYTTADVARIFGVTPRSILNLIASGKLTARDMPGWARFLAQDLEDYLKNSKKGSR